MESIGTHQTVRLSAGSHAAPHDGACVLELASMLNAEPFSDRPRSVCPALREFLQSYNDGLPDDLRQELFASGLRDRRHARPAAGDGMARPAVRGLGAIGGRNREHLDQVQRLDAVQLRPCRGYAAQVARSNPWCHGQTVAFVTWLARKSTPGAVSPCRCHRHLLAADRAPTRRASPRSSSR